MSAGRITELLSFAGIGLMLLSIFFIYLSRNIIKVKIISSIVAFIAYISLIVSGFIIFIVVVSWPS
ncbi:DUF2768 domain-containing protein [Bacillus sp. RG28]|uniref:DUF2768 domain-containing protein n=1 Tax=Gottfriedia endophytica TaxID=2820819 RepID=A0A940SFP6_9BACI|nr:DUF2768 family protein [Gottfriedia endophytica]MBP0724217.1 DUF2768 domain-containing protein [Gottfriedia endophytica]